MKPKLAAAFIISFIVIGLGALAPYFDYQFNNQKPLMILGVVPPFEFTDSDSQKFASNQLKNRVWVANFFFTSCQGPCPLINAEVKKLSSLFSTRPDVDFASFSIDPATDTPSVLHEYAVRFQADTKKWHFLTGSPENVKALIDGVHLSSPGDPKIHSTRLLLVDRDSKIRGYYDATDKVEITRLTKDLGRLVRENS